MASPFMLTYCDGALGCDCPKERRRIAEHKRQQSIRSARYKEKQKKKLV